MCRLKDRSSRTITAIDLYLHAEKGGARFSQQTPIFFSCTQVRTPSWSRIAKGNSRSSLILTFMALAGAAMNGRATELTAKPGAYRVVGRTVYIGIEAEPPDEPAMQFYDTKTRRIGTLENISAHEYRTHSSPEITFVLHSPAAPVVENPFVVEHGHDRLGASLWRAPGAGRRSTIILIHGADDETRAMGFLIPYFVSHGLNVVTYDQRGTGESTGNWRYTSPDSKADDIVAILQRVETDPAVDARRLGVWGFSNGGWVAPIVAVRFPLAFMILKSAPSESIGENVLYEVGQALREHDRFTPEQISHALAFERTMLMALQTNSNWSAASEALSAAKKQPWFPYMRIPPGMATPPPPPVLAALHAALIYDPTATLQRVRTPTLALFGALDKNVDSADSAERFRKAFNRAGLKDLTIVTFRGAGHTLVRSTTGYEDDPSLPQRTAEGYPEVMVRWLDARAFTK